jgi:hypothetical protein
MSHEDKDRERKREKKIESGSIERRLTHVLSASIVEK